MSLTRRPTLNALPLALALAVVLPACPAKAQIAGSVDTESGAGTDATTDSAPSTPSADDHHHAKATDLDAIVVTASPLKNTAEQMAQPVDVLSGEQLDKVRAASLGETVQSLPGVQSSNFGPGVGRPIIRGLDGPRVGILSDGLITQDVSTVSQDHSPTIEPFLADQIEVLKGPSTLLYGSGAIGGVVNVVDGRIPETSPGDAFSGRAEMRYDSASRGTTDLLRVDTGTDRFALHADAVYRNARDYETPDGRQVNSFIDTKTGAVGGSLLGDWGFLGASASRFEDDYGNPGEPGDRALGERGVSLALRQTRYDLKAGLNDPFDGVRNLRFNFAHTDYEHIEFEGDVVGTQFLKNADEMRVELTHAPMAGWNGAVGAQGSDTSFEAIGEESFVPHTRTRSAGVFVFEQKQWNALQLDFGARVDRIRADPEGGAQRAFTPVSFSAGGLWKLNEAWRLSLDLDHAERAPAEEELFANGPHIATLAFEIGDSELGKEAANQIELGLHHHSQRVDAKVSAYYNRFNDFIYIVDTGQFVPRPDGGTLPVRQWTQGDARFRGLEGEVTFHLLKNDTDGLDLRLFGDTVRATLTTGGNVPRIPPSRVGADLAWSNARWRASIGAVRNARQDKVAINETPTDGYTFVNAHAAYHWDTQRSDGTEGTGWELFLDGSNLTDRIGRVHTSFLKDDVMLPGRSVSTGIRVFF
ncbi:MAG: TonB-dependent receptor [Luteimonas sp.]